MRLLIQLLLIVGVILVVIPLFRSRGAQAQAIRRVGLLAFAAFAVVSILLPAVWNHLAALLGVGRGADLVLYGLVVAFLSSTATRYLRFRDVEAKLTLLARRIALDEAAPPADQGGALPPSSLPPSALPPGSGREGSTR